MLRLLSWTGCDKVGSSDLKLLISKQDPASNGTFKMSAPRKRKQSGDASGQAERKRAKVDAEKPDSTALPPPSQPPHFESAVVQPVAATSAADVTASHLPTPPDTSIETPSETDNDGKMELQAVSRLDSVLSVIQTQISLEILLKHKELRLIDQEIAKCQVALEQLRRCSEIPFPATQSMSSAVSSGTGLSLRTSFPTPLPSSPAPWGVQDGPYSRHYAQWLLPDSQFDGGHPTVTTPAPVGKSPMTFRSQSRGSFAETPLSATNRAQRSGKLKSLPAGYGQPKEKATGPMIVKRKSDGVSVKLVCPDCGRFDFGSAQGFINHCRIGHGRSFASHDAAADACGEVVQVDETGAAVGVELVATPTAGNIHPLIRSAKLLKPAPLRLVSSYPASANAQTPTQPSPSFRGSTATPNLSELIKGRGLGLDLESMVADAKTKVHLPESEDESDDDEQESPVQSMAQGRHPQVAGTKQPSRPHKAPASSPLTSSLLSNGGLNLRGGESRSHDRPRMILPLNEEASFEERSADTSPTTESNQAPSLVDDDEEFEAHSPSSSSIFDEPDTNEVDFQIHDYEDEGRSELQAPEFQPSCTQPARPTHSRRPSAIRRQVGQEEKHVSFVSPSPAREISHQAAKDQKKRKLP
jgi:ADA HAT complex component 1